MFAVLLVLSRMPGSESFFPWVDFFRTALVVHVDQSVLIWFLAMAGVVWSLVIPADSRWLMVQRGAFWLALAGTLGIALSAFVGDGAPLMNNYVPVLQRPFFFWSHRHIWSGYSASVRVGVHQHQEYLCRQMGVCTCPVLLAMTISFAVIMSLLALVTAWLQMPSGVAGQAYYEYLFWGAGHTLQFAYTQLLLLAWLLLALRSGVVVPSRLPLDHLAVAAGCCAGAADSRHLSAVRHG